MNSNFNLKLHITKKKKTIYSKNFRACVECEKHPPDSTNFHHSQNNDNK